MNEQTDNGRSRRSQPPAGTVGVRYFSVVCLLLLAIVVVLAALLWRERANSGRSTRTALRDARSLQSDVAALAMRAAAEQSGEVDREALPSLDVELDGRPATVMLIGPEEGRNIGLQPGDLVFVMNREPAPRAPQTKPAE
jgi:hypothetical protein